MVDYRNCTDNMFNSAMAMKNKDVDKIPTNYLYILYTKYKAEAVKLKTVDQLKAMEARERKKKYWNELYRRKEVESVEGLVEIPGL